MDESSAQIAKTEKYSEKNREYADLSHKLSTYDDFKGRITPDFLKRYEKERGKDYEKLQSLLNYVGPIDPAHDVSLKALNEFLDENENAKLQVELGKLSKEFGLNGMIIFNVSKVSGVPTIKATMRLENGSVAVSMIEIKKYGDNWFLPSEDKGFQLSSLVFSLEKMRKAISNCNLDALRSKTSGGITSRDLTAFAKRIGNGEFKIKKGNITTPTTDGEMASKEANGHYVSLNDWRTQPPSTYSTEDFLKQYSGAKIVADYATSPIAETNLSRSPEVQNNSPEINSPSAFAEALKKSPAKYLNPVAYDDNGPKEFTITIPRSDKNAYRYSRIQHFVGPEGVIPLQKPEEYQLKVGDKAYSWDAKKGSWYDGDQRLLVSWNTTFTLDKKSQNVANVEVKKDDDKERQKEISEIAKLTTEFYGRDGLNIPARVKNLNEEWNTYYSFKNADGLKITANNNDFDSLMDTESRIIKDIVDFNKTIEDKNYKTAAGIASFNKLKTKSTEALTLLEKHKKEQEKEGDKAQATLDVSKVLESEPA